MSKTKTTDVPGAKVLIIRDPGTHQVYRFILIKISEMFPDGPPTVEELANTVGVSPQEVFHSLLRFPRNAHMVDAFYREHVGGAFSDRAEALRKLHVEAHTFKEVSSDKGSFVVSEAFLVWRVEPDGDKPIVLRKTAFFHNIMVTATAKRKHAARIQTITPDFDELRDQLDAINVQAAGLEGSLSSFKTMTENHAKEIAVLTALEGLLNAMLGFPKETPVDADDKTEVEHLRSKLRELTEKSRLYLLVEPVEPYRAKLKKRIEDSARKLRDLIEDKTFLENLQVLVDNRDIAPAKLFQYVLDTARRAYKDLCQSPESDDILAKHINPLIDHLAGKNVVDFSKCSFPDFPEFQEEVRKKAPEVSSGPTFLGIIGSLAGMGPSVAGNMPGPNALAVSILELSAPLLMQAALSGSEAAAVQGGRLYRALLNVSNLDEDAINSLNLALNEGKWADLHRVDWSGRFMNSAAWGGAVAVLSAIAFIVRITDDAEFTLGKWADLVASGSGTVLGLAIMLHRLEVLTSVGLVENLATGAAGKALGVVGGVAVMISGGYTAMEEYETRDRVGMAVGVATSISGALSVAGFLIVAGAETAWVGGLGLWLMAAGAIIGIGAAIYAFVRELSITGGHRVFEAYLEEYGKTDYALSIARKERKDLEGVWERVRTIHHATFIDHFWDVNPDRSPQLEDFGFSTDHIGLIVDEDYLDVVNILEERKKEERKALKSR